MAASSDANAFFPVLMTIGAVKQIYSATVIGTDP